MRLTAAELRAAVVHDGRVSAAPNEGELLLRSIRCGARPRTLAPARVVRRRTPGAEYAEAVAVSAAAAAREQITQVRGRVGTDPDVAAERELPAQVRDPLASRCCWADVAERESGATVERAQHRPAALRERWFKCDPSKKRAENVTCNTVVRKVATSKSRHHHLLFFIVTNRRVSPSLPLLWPSHPSLSLPHIQFDGACKVPGARSAQRPTGLRVTVPAGVLSGTEVCALCVCVRSPCVLVERPQRAPQSTSCEATCRPEAMVRAADDALMSVADLRSFSRGV